MEKKKIEEAAKEYLNSGNIPNDYQAFLAGAECQSVQMYSEDEVKQIASDAYVMGKKGILSGVFNKWFNQYKQS